MKQQKSNPSPTMKECKCTFGRYFYMNCDCPIHSQPSEEKECRCHCHCKYNPAWACPNRCNQAKDTCLHCKPSDQKECACHCHIDGLQEGWTHCRHCGGTKPSSSSSWEKELELLFCKPWGTKEVKSFISQLLKKEREKVIEEVKKNTKDLTKYETEFTCPCGIEHSVQFLIRKPKVMKGKITEITINGEQLKK